MKCPYCGAPSMNYLPCDDCCCPECGDAPNHGICYDCDDKLRTQARVDQMILRVEREVNVSPPAETL